MKNLKAVSFGLVLFNTAILVAYKKEGCMDPDSVNYQEDAKKDDGSCYHNGKSVFWFDKSVSDSLTARGVNVISFSINDKYAGSKGVEDFTSSSRGCEGDPFDSFVTSIDDYLKVATVPYVVKDQVNNIIWSGSITLNGGSCAEGKLTF